MSNNALTVDSIPILIAKIDELVSSCIDRILHHPRFQRLEATWRGLHYLVSKVYDNSVSSFKIKVLDVTGEELEKDLLTAVEFDQSVCFKKIYSEEFDTPGGEPFGLVLGDYWFSHKTVNARYCDSIHILDALGKISAAAFSPFVANADANLFGIDEFEEITSLKLPLKIFEQAEYLRWNKLRCQEDSRFIGFLYPRVVMREPYQIGALDKELPSYHEKITEKSDYLWGGSVYVFAEIVLQAYVDTGWFAQVRGTSLNKASGKVVAGPARINYHINQENLSKIRTDVVITKNLERELNNQGIITMIDRAFEDSLYQYATPSFQLSKKYRNDDVKLNSSLATKFEYILSASRFAHYIKIMMREKLGTFSNADECESYMQRWLNKYCADYTNDTMALPSHPLAQGSVKVEALANDPSKYQCRIHIKPHYQLEHLETEIKLFDMLSSNTLMERNL